MRRLLLLLMLVLPILGGCGLVRAGIAALHSTSHFQKLESDNRILYEPGADLLAKQVARHLPEAIAAVEREQNGPFSDPIEIYVCASEKSFAAHTGAGEKPLGTVSNRLFISGRLKREPERTARILTHELSHLHLLQRLGNWNYIAELPPWFTEGLAVVVSKGGGAEKVSEVEAVRAIIDGKHFTPGSSGGVFFRKYGHAFGLEPHMFYRQSAMFVAFLQHLGHERFRHFMLTLENGGKFAPSFEAAFGMEIDSAWTRFIDSLSTTSA